MRLWLLGFMLVSGIASAAQSMYSMFAAGDYVQPLSVMQQIEKGVSGVIAEFEMETQEGELVYQFELINPLANSITRFEYRARDGKLLKQKASKVSADDLAEVEAARLIAAKNQTFSGIIAKAIKERKAFLTEAKLDHDLGISYLEIKLLDDTGKFKLAFDVDNLRPLPLLQWD
ncbi:PepSY domain-containing protein [Shewanella glacialipiscicola]|uniref:PepSY domain-containing protein n=1 Tax=Shewanella glacialipiscicola TaxID=614069 RepID=UPI003D7A50F0